MKKFLIAFFVVLQFAFSQAAFASTADLVDVDRFNMITQEIHGEEYETGTVIPLYRYGDIIDSDLTYQQIVEETSYFIAPLLKNGEAVGEISFYYSDGDWNFGHSTENGSYLYDAIGIQGTELLYILGKGSQVLIPETDETVYSLKEFGSAQAVVISDEPLTLSDFVLCASYDNATSGGGGLSGGKTVFNEAYLKQAKAYWAEQEDVEAGSSSIVWIVVSVIAALIVCCAILLERKLRTQR